MFLKNSRSMFFLTLIFYYFRREQSHIALGTYINNTNKNTIKIYIKMNSSSKQNGLKTRNRRKQKNWFLKRIGKKCIPM